MSNTSLHSYNDEGGLEVEATLEDGTAAESENKQPTIFAERTLALIKPDAVDKAEEIERFIINSGFTIIKKRQLQLSPEQASEFYAPHYGKMFFPRLITFMSSGEIVALLLAKQDAISLWKELMGPSDSESALETSPDSLRGRYGTDDIKNAVHGSDGFINAHREIRFFFPESVLEPVPIANNARDYLEQNVNGILLKGLTQLCKEKPLDPLNFLADWLAKNNPNKPIVQNPAT